MQTPLHITFNDIEPSTVIENNIRERVNKLEQFNHNITSCRVAVAQTSRRGHRGHLYRVHIELTVPDHGEVVVSRDPGLDHSHEDVYVAIRDAFSAARRQLQDRARHRERPLKVH